MTLVVWQLSVSHKIKYKEPKQVATPVCFGSQSVQKQCTKGINKEVIE